MGMPSMSELTSRITSSTSLLPNAQQRAKLRRIRTFKDNFSRYGIMTAGMAVVLSLGLIFFYLFSEVAPLLRGASVDITKTLNTKDFGQAQEDASEYLSLDRYEEIGGTFNRSGRVEFFNLRDGKALVSATMPKAAQAGFASLATSTADHGLVAYGYSNGQVTVAKTQYDLSYPNDQRLVTPSLQFPLG
jgi:phosphate transport system permease protein